MAGLFLNMMKEEWRVHSTMFGSLNFALFPVMICAIAFMGTFLLPLIQESFPTGDLVILIHAQYLMLGLMVDEMIEKSEKSLHELKELKESFNNKK